MAWIRKKKIEEATENKAVVEPVVVQPTPVKVSVDNQERYSLTTIATQTNDVIVDKATDETIDVQSALVLILNKLDKIEEVLLN